VTTEKKTEPQGLTTRGRSHARFGWTLLLLALAFGAVLETLEGFRWAPLVNDAWKGKLWSLAHFHGAALGLLNLIYVSWAEARALSAAQRVRASRALLIGSTLFPLGFLLGGIAPSEGDPSLGIALSPLGAVFVIYAALVQTLGVWRKET
jgi:hypothetical protein